MKKILPIVIISLTASFMLTGCGEEVTTPIDTYEETIKDAHEVDKLMEEHNKELENATE